MRSLKAMRWMMRMTNEANDARMTNEANGSEAAYQISKCRNELWTKMKARTVWLRR